MILVDSSVWIDYFRGVATPQSDQLDSLLGVEPLAIGDLILAEVLHGFSGEREFNQVRKSLDAFMHVELGGKTIAIQAARNFRALRNLGVTVRKTIDTIIATRCIESGYTLLHSEREFDAFETHLGLLVMSSGKKRRANRAPCRAVDTDFEGCNARGAIDNPDEISGCA